MIPDKTVLRKQFAAFRASLREEEYAARSTAIIQRMRALPELQAVRTVHCYWPLVMHREVDIRPLITWFQKRDIQVVLPVVSQFRRTRTETPRLRHILLANLKDLQQNQWGIHEPIHGKCVPLETLDAIVVPALGADCKGHRIGHGFGYYDEFLSQVHVPTLCPVYDACLVESVIPDEHDVPVSVLITEFQTLRPNLA